VTALEGLHTTGKYRTKHDAHMLQTCGLGSPQKPQVRTWKSEGWAFSPFSANKGRASSRCSGSETGSFLRLTDYYITKLKAQGPSRTCNESTEEQLKLNPRKRTWKREGWVSSTYLASKFRVSLRFYMSTSFIRNSALPWGYRRALGILIL